LPINEPNGNHIKASTVRKTGLAVMVNPSIGYRIGKKIEIYLTPFYRYAFYKKNLYPINNQQYFGIGAGLNLIL
jgi:hypothetical protein